MSVALISAVDPYPTDAGKKVVLAGFCDYFAERHGAEQVHYIKVGAPPGDGFAVTVHSVPGPGGRDVLRAVGSRTALGRASLQESFLYSAKTAAAIRTLLADLQPALQVFDTVRMAQYASDDVAGRQICYLDDLFSERYDRMLSAAQRYPDVEISPLGNFAEHVPARLRPLATRRASQTALLRLERSLVRRSEDRTARRFRRCLLVNADEARSLQQRTGVAASRIWSVPPLVRTASVTTRTYAGAPAFVFLGLLSLPHNEDGVYSFLTTVWPLVLARFPDARLRVIGRDVSDRLLTLARRYPDTVSVDGYVPDLGDALDSATALVNPLRFGSGIKLKVFEALSRALPVVSTTIGAEGIASGPGTGIVVADEPRAMADALCALVPVDENRRCSREAREHFATTYSREAVFRAYDEVF
ncbi:glycosyltransferase family 4 protein [Mycobacterium sp. PSTR-4-N]|uniref:glycosyltransferase n=1 Tax=Mycobacterium sp. PSTR-4-N TaxID=2917745 RepID=UPI001F151F53|nr:glycosyltransferase family 4 protein [Mycobacterium sp. PSTR-4-N]MCG7596284.1 glycosyltransferase family 4 protein [Mycobacterium sp. PSTR-4-N]